MTPGKSVGIVDEEREDAAYGSGSPFSGGVQVDGVIASNP